MVRGAGKGRLQGVARELGLVWLFVLFQNLIFLCDHPDSVRCATGYYGQERSHIPSYNGLLSLASVPFKSVRCAKVNDTLERRRATTGLSE